MHNLSCTPKYKTCKTGFFLPPRLEFPELLMQHSHRIINLWLWNGRSNIISTSGTKIPRQGIVLSLPETEGSIWYPQLYPLWPVSYYSPAHSAPVTPVSLLFSENTPSNLVLQGLAVLSVRVSLSPLIQTTHPFTYFKSLCESHFLVEALPDHLLKIENSPLAFPTLLPLLYLPQ